MNKLFTVLLLLFFISCKGQTPTTFSEAALSEKLLSTNQKTITFNEVLKQNTGKKIVIDFWASWCRDCLVSLPRLKKLQKKYSEAVFLFLSVDENPKAWSRAIEKYKIKGQHYNLPKGWKNQELLNFIDLNWIPRYMVIDEKGKIALFKATKAIDKRIEDALKE